MKSPLIITLMLVAAVIGAVSAVKGQNKSRKTPDELMSWLSAQAVVTANQHGVQLDYSPQSIKKVDAFLGYLHKGYEKKEISKGTRGLAMMFGAYIGEVIHRTEPDAKWEKGDPVGGEKSLSLHTKNGTANVCGWCYTRIVNGDEDNVWFKYDAFENHKPTTNESAGSTLKQVILTN